MHGNTGLPYLRGALFCRSHSVTVRSAHRKQRILLQYPISTNNLIERYHLTLKTSITAYKRNRRVCTLLSEVLLVRIAQFFLQQLHDTLCHIV
jgi:hypothetical protein